MNAHDALEQARAAWERTQPQLQLFTPWGPDHRPAAPPASRRVVSPTRSAPTSTKRM